VPGRYEPLRHARFSGIAGYRHLPKEVRELADKNFALMQQDPHHPFACD